METTVVFEEKVSLTPKDLNKVETTSIDRVILDKLRNRLEGKCSTSGWVIPNTLKLISRSMCQSMAGHFTGAMITWVQAEGAVIYPTDGAVVKGVVAKKNKMGIFVDYKNAIQIMVPRDLHLGDEGFDAIKIGDEVNVEIKRSMYQVNDPYIASAGVYRGAAAAAAVPTEEVVPLSAVPEESEEESEEEPEEELEAEEDAEDAEELEAEFGVTE
jgi:DNA-directed RNA polymerase subunit E'/Rpb7